MTDDIFQLIDWIINQNCECVAMESTGVYWKPIYNLLGLEGIKTMVVNAQHIKNVPGRKTDVKDAEWIAKLLKHGLLKASFIPSREQRELRELVRYRRKMAQASRKAWREESKNGGSHTLLVIIYHVLKKRVPYNELGSDYFRKLNEEANVKRSIRLLKEYGYDISKTS